MPWQRRGPNSEAAVNYQKWLEGNAEVKILGVWRYNVSHTILGVIEAENMQAITNLLRPQMHTGNVAILPIMDSIEIRKKGGHWGK
jgi:hypothetical protein